MAPKSNAIVAGLAFAALFVGSISLVLLINLKDDAVRIPGASIAWWKKTLIYHVYVPSFMDSDGDGYGDLKVMSKSETELIVDSWALAQPDLHKHGLEFFIRLFSEHPDVQTKHFPQMDVNEIDTLSKHGYRVMRAVDTMVLHVKNSDDESLVAKIHEIVCDILHAYLAIALGSNLSGEGAQAWRKLLDTLIAVVGQELIRLENEEKEKKRQLFKN